MAIQWWLYREGQALSYRQPSRAEAHRRAKLISRQSPEELVMVYYYHNPSGPNKGETYYRAGKVEPQGRW